MSEQSFVERHFRHNFIVNVSDLALWATGSALVSTATVLPMFMAHLTASPVIIGLIPSLQFLGWRLPQLFTAGVVEKLPRKLPFVLSVSLNERLPILMLGLIVLIWPHAEPDVLLAATLLLLGWQAFGSGACANAWQAMVAKVIPATHWGLFFGLGNALGALLGVGGAALSHYFLSHYPFPYGFGYSCVVASVFLMLSWCALALTKEEAKPPARTVPGLREYLRSLPGVLRQDRNFSLFLLLRSVGAFPGMGSAFLAVYAAERFSLGDEAAATFTTVILVSQALLNPILGRMGDRYGHKLMITLSFWAQAASMAVAATAPNSTLFLTAFALKSAADAIGMSSGLPIVFEFCSEETRPTYIGLANTLTAPPLVLVPVVGGAMVESVGYVGTFCASALLGILVAVLWHRCLDDPRSLAMRTITADPAGLAAAEGGGGQARPEP
jgi:MFS family permease